MLEFTCPDIQLKKILAKLLPTKIAITNLGYLYYWSNPTNTHYGDCVKDSELLQLCHEIEEKVEIEKYSDKLMNVIRDNPAWTKGAVEARYQTAHATWQQRTIALANYYNIPISTL